MLKGGRMEKRWQPMSADTWCGPSSRSTSFIAVKIGRSGHPVQKPGGRLCTTGAAWIGMVRGAAEAGRAASTRVAAAATAAPAAGTTGEAPAALASTA
jgi:hypothetical protein